MKPTRHCHECHRQVEFQYAVATRDISQHKFHLGQKRLSTHAAQIPLLLARSFRRAQLSYRVRHRRMLLLLQLASHGFCRTPKSRRRSLRILLCRARLVRHHEVLLCVKKLCLPFRLLLRAVAR